VLGVKIVRGPETLPRTGAPTGLLLALGLGLVVAGSGLVARAGAYDRRH
jgi:LPXTG-motif cell wall-anchored protein